MIGNDSIKFDISIESLWHAWLAYRKGKQRTSEFEKFSYNIEVELVQLHKDLANGSYKHGSYRYFEVIDNKKRTIVVAQFRDRVVHRLLYDYLIAMYDKTFIFDAWSCRKNKGLHGAIDRAQSLLNRNQNAFIWRSDISKFFDSVDQRVLFQLLQRRIKDPIAIILIEKVISSYHSKFGHAIGMPIGNLTSQIFANVYLNELDRYVSHTLHPIGYLRYGDDFVIFGKNRQEVLNLRLEIIKYIESTLHLHINLKSDIIRQSKQGLKYLGCWLYPSSRNLTNRNFNRIKERLSLQNIASYYGIATHCQPNLTPTLNWMIEQLLC